MFYSDILLSCSFVPSLAGMKSYKVRSIKDAYIPNLAEVRGQLKGIIIHNNTGHTTVICLFACLQSTEQ